VVVVYRAGRLTLHVIADAADRQLDRIMPSRGVVAWTHCAERRQDVVRYFLGTRFDEQPGLRFPVFSATSVRRDIREI
jgi:hypothetical protein